MNITFRSVDFLAQLKQHSKVQTELMTPNCNFLDSGNILFSGHRRQGKVKFPTTKEAIIQLCQEIGKSFTHDARRAGSGAENFITRVSQLRTLTPKDQADIILVAAEYFKKPKFQRKLRRFAERISETESRSRALKPFQISEPQPGPRLETKEEILTYYRQSVSRTRVKSLKFLRALGSLKEDEQLYVIKACCATTPHVDMQKSLLQIVTRFTNPNNKATAWKAFKDCANEEISTLIRQKAQQLNRPEIYGDILRLFPDDPEDAVATALERFTAHQSKSRLQALALADITLQKPLPRLRLAKVYANDPYLGIAITAFNLEKAVSETSQYEALRSEHYKAFANSHHATVRFLSLLRANTLHQLRQETLLSFAQNPTLTRDMNNTQKKKVVRIFENSPEMLKHIADETLKSAVLSTLSTSNQPSVLLQVLDNAKTLTHDIAHGNILMDMMRYLPQQTHLINDPKGPHILNTILDNITSIKEESYKALLLRSLLRLLNDTDNTQSKNPLALKDTDIEKLQQRVLDVGIALTDEIQRVSVVTTFQNGSPELRRKSVQSCQNLTKNQAIETLIEAYAAQDDPEIITVLSNALNQLEKGPTTHFATALCHFSKNPNEDTRNWALSRVFSMPGNLSKAMVLQTYLSDPSVSIQKATSQQIALHIREDNFNVNLAVASSTNRNTQIRKQGLNGLWLVKDESRIAKVLPYYLDDEDPRLRQEVLGFIRVLQNPSLKTGILKPMIFDADPTIAEEALAIAKELPEKWRDKVIEPVVSLPPATAEPIIEKPGLEPQKAPLPIIVRPDVQINTPIYYSQRLQDTFKTAQTQLESAKSLFENSQIYEPSIFLCRPVPSKRNWLFRRDDPEKPTYEAVANSEIRNIGNLANIPEGYPDMVPIEGIYVFRGYQERFTRGGMGVYHILNNHGPSLFPILDQSLDSMGADKNFSQFTLPDGKPAPAERIAEMISKALVDGKLFRLKVAGKSVVYFKLKGEREKPKHRFFTFPIEYAYPDHRVVGKDIRTGETFQKLHVVLGLYPGSNKAFLYTAFPTHGRVHVPPQLLKRKKATN